jgi:hypothetical protein
MEIAFLLISIRKPAEAAAQYSWLKRVTEGAALHAVA